jgi:hypothetical protein
MWEDPIVKEVREARLEIEKECSGDFRKLYDHALKIQKKLAKKRVSAKNAKPRRLASI